VSQQNTVFEVAIIGQGYVGLPLAMAAVKAGWKVIGIDKSESRVNELQSGMSHISEIADSDLQDAIKGDLYAATTDFSKVRNSKIVILCVPTPIDKENQPDLSFIDIACSEVAKFLSKDTLLISESTSYPGTLRNRIIPNICAISDLSSNELFFATAPERVNPGDKKWGQSNTPRLISGINERSTTTAKEFYETFCSKVIVTETPEIAEAAKLLENTFRLVNLALINEFDQICSLNNLDARKVIEAAASKPYGFMPFFPGLGVGGHCIPVDPLYLTWWAEQVNFMPELILTSVDINRNKPKAVAKKAIQLIADLSLKSRVLIVGITYKAGVADTRESPSFILKEELEKFGVKADWNDDLVSEWNGALKSQIIGFQGLIIFAVPQGKATMQELMDSESHILDCTGTFARVENTTRF
jgi:UDP-N-acetyl-D-glucosamine dehydrogenase